MFEFCALSVVVVNLPWNRTPTFLQWVPKEIRSTSEQL